MILASSVSDVSERTVARKDRCANSNLSQSILQLAADLSGKVGRTTLAQILAGSGAKKLKESGYTRLPLFGAFKSFKQDQVLGEIDELVEADDLQVSSGMYPKVQITRGGLAKMKSESQSV
jgi:superfamily II DNA helicase RecQ